MRVLLLLFAVCGQLQANDMSYFDISAGTGDTPTKVQFIVTDSLGRKTGFKSYVRDEDGDIGVRPYKEIPHSGYLMEATGSLDPSLVPDEPESASFGIDTLIRDTYTVTVVGFGDTKYFLDMTLSNAAGKISPILNSGYITAGTTQQYSIYLDPTSGAPAPVIIKIVTFDTLRQDLQVAQKLNQLGDDKFAASLAKNIDLAEKLSGVCNKRKVHDKNDAHDREECRPAIAVLDLFIKRLEAANRKCDSKDPKACDEENDWADFAKAHRKDHDYDDFFKAWNKDGWQKDRKAAKRFVTDEALKIIREDAQWLIKSLGGEADKAHGGGGSSGNDSGKKGGDKSGR